MTGCGQLALPKVLKWSGGPLGCPIVFGRPSRMCGSCERPSRMSGNGQDAILDVREWSGGPLKCHGSVRKALPDVREDLSDVWE